MCILQKIKTEKRKEECYAIIKCRVVVKHQENEIAVRSEEFVVLSFSFMLEDVEKVATSGFGLTV